MRAQSPAQRARGLILIHREGRSEERPQCFLGLYRGQKPYASAYFERYRGRYEGGRWRQNRSFWVCSASCWRHVDTDGFTRGTIVLYMLPQLSLHFF